MNSRELIIFLLVLPGIVCGSVLKADEYCPSGPGCGTPVAGDINLDLKVDFSDVSDLGAFWLTEYGMFLQNEVEHDPNFYSDMLKNILIGGPHRHVPFTFYTPWFG